MEKSRIANTPFKFLDAYQKDDFKIFFGREQETKNLYHALSGVKHLLVYGPSGAGKTSLIECGLRNQFSDADWFALTIRKGTNITTSVFNTINEALEIKIIDPKTNLLIDKNSTFEEAVQNLFEECYQPVYLLFDQFEELLISGNEAEKINFFTRLNQLIRHRVPCRILLIMREEFIGHLSEFEQYCPTLFQHRFRVEKIRLDNVRDVIIRTLLAPQFVADFKVEESDILADTILSKLPDNKKEIELTHVQMFLNELWERALKNTTKDTLPILEKGLINKEDNLERLLNNFLRKQLQEMESLFSKNTPLEILACLITEQKTKFQVTLKQLLDNLKQNGILLSNEELEKIIWEFINRKVLRKIKINNEIHYEIAHDTLALVIGQSLTEEMQNREKSRRIYTVYEERKGIFSQDDLDYLKSFKNHLEYPVKLAKKIAESNLYIEQLNKKRSRRQRLLLVTTITVLFGIVIFFLSDYYNEKFANITKSELLVNQALQCMDENPTKALNFARKALEVNPNNQSAKKVIQLLSKDNIFYKDILTDTVNAKTVAFSPNNKLVAFAERDFVYIKDINKTVLFKRKLHQGSINDLVFDTDSSIISVGDDGRIMCWNFRKNRIKEIEYQKHVFTKNIHLNALDISADDRYIFVGRGGKGSDCLLIDREADRAYVLDDVSWKVHDVLFSKPDSNATLPILQKELLIMAGDDRRILMYDLNSRKLIAESFAKNHPKTIFSLDLDSRTNRIVTACNDERIRVFDLVPNHNPKISNLPYILRQINILTKHQDAVHSVSFSKNGLKMVSASSDNTAIVWDTKEWKPLYTLKGHTNRIVRAIFSNDDNYIASIGRDVKIIIWNLRLKKPDVKPIQHTRRVSALQLSKNGKRAFSGTWGNKNTPKRALINWNTTTWRPMRVDSFDNDIEALATFYQDSVLVAVGKSIYLMDYKNKTKKIIGNAEGTIKAIAIAPNNKFIAYAGRDGKLRIIPNNRTSKKKVLKIRRDNIKAPKDDDIYSIGISPDSRYIVVGRRNRTIVIWDIEENIQLIPPILAHDSISKVDNEVFSITFINQNQFLTTGRDNQIILWEINQEGRNISIINRHKSHAGGIRCLAVHPTANLYITGGGDGDGLLKLWDMNGNLYQVINAYYDDIEICSGDDFKCQEDFGIVTAVIFSKDGSKIIFGTGNGKIKSIFTIEGALSKGEIYNTMK